ncbi:hypothetical protein E8P82_08900 [Arthrobacter echini]|uniref:DUF5666 domain-containing protein n=1 Tax=Arthrobacter echini TaxID=1529066 RepID=A0A4V3Z5J3_9MICC|nr:hypothetical protein [Arthrobacter echini]THJ66559.1 hypothetical protein E8P82_08900 [Arthrobacter echini]
MKTRNGHNVRLMTAGVFAVAGLALAGCNTEGPEEGVDVEDISEGDVASSSPAAETPMAGEGYSGLYDQNFYDEARADAYAGQEVTVSAEVTETLSDDTFVIAGTANTAVDPLLIVEEEEIPPVDVGQVVQVTGTVMQDFDVAAAEEMLGIDLDDELYADFIGEPYVSITSGEVIEED